MLKLIRNYRTFRKTYNELDQLSDRELRDIGLSRGDIARVAMDAVFK